MVILQNVNKDSMNSKIIGILFIGLMIASCVPSEEIKVQRLNQIKSIDVFPDSSFFSDLRGMQSDGEYVYALDVNRRNVVRLDQELSEIEEYGIGGRGPEELTAPFSFLVNNGIVSIIDFMSMDLKHYDEKGYVNKEHLDFLPDDGRFGATSRGFIISVRSEYNQFALFSPDSTQLAGETIKIGSLRKTLTMNSCHILTYGDKIIVLPIALPYVFLYDKDATPLNTIDLSMPQFYKDNLLYITENSRQDDDKSYYILNIDAYMEGDDLYILCPRYGNEYKSDRIIKVNLQTRKIDAVFALPHSNYRSLCVLDDKLYAFNTTRCSLDVIGL